MLLLRETAQHKSLNKMDAKNLSMVFAPSLLRSPGALKQEMQDTTNAARLVQYLIEDFDEIFAMFPKPTLYVK